MVAKKHGHVPKGYYRTSDRMSLNLVITPLAKFCFFLFYLQHHPPACFLKMRSISVQSHQPLMPVQCWIIAIAGLQDLRQL